MGQPLEDSRSVYIARAVFLFLKHKDRPVHLSLIQRLIFKTVGVEINSENVTKFARENEGLFIRKNHTISLAKDIIPEDLDEWITIQESLIKRKGPQPARNRTGDGVTTGRTRRRA